MAILLVRLLAHSSRIEPQGRDTSRELRKENKNREHGVDDELAAMGISRRAGDEGRAKESEGLIPVWDLARGHSPLRHVGRYCSPVDAGHPPCSVPPA